MAPAPRASLGHAAAQDRAPVAWRPGMRRRAKVPRTPLQPGTTVAVLGANGAGKSTVVRSLARELPEARLAYLGAYPKDAQARRRPAGLDTLERCLSLAGRGAIVRRHRRRGRMVLLDRHPLEVVFGPPSSSVRTRVRRWLVSHTVAAPDVVIVLDAPAEVLHARQTDHALEAVAAMRQRYRRLASVHGAVVVGVDRPLPEVLADVREVIATGHQRPPRR